MLRTMFKDKQVRSALLVKNCEFSTVGERRVIFLAEKHYPNLLGGEKKDFSAADFERLKNQLEVELPLKIEALSKAKQTDFERGLSDIITELFDFLDQALKFVDFLGSHQIRSGFDFEVLHYQKILTCKNDLSGQLKVKSEFSKKDFENLKNSLFEGVFKPIQMLFYAADVKDFFQQDEVNVGATEFFVNTAATRDKYIKLLSIDSLNFNYRRDFKLKIFFQPDEFLKPTEKKLSLKEIKSEIKKFEELVNDFAGKFRGIIELEKLKFNKRILLQYNFGELFGYLREILQDLGGVDQADWPESKKEEYKKEISNLILVVQKIIFEFDAYLKCVDDSLHPLEIDLDADSQSPEGKKKEFKKDPVKLTDFICRQIASIKDSKDPKSDLIFLRRGIRYFIERQDNKLPQPFEFFSFVLPGQIRDELLDPLKKLFNLVNPKQ